jgi:hypothetical protein
VGKNAVTFNIPEAEAVDRLQDFDPRARQMD